MLRPEPDHDHEWKDPVCEDCHDGGFLLRDHLIKGNSLAVQTLRKIRVVPETSLVDLLFSAAVLCDKYDLTVCVILLNLFYLSIIDHSQELIVANFLYLLLQRRREYDSVQENCHHKDHDHIIEESLERIQVVRVRLFSAVFCTHMFSSLNSLSCIRSYRQKIYRTADRNFCLFTCCYQRIMCPK